MEAVVVLLLMLGEEEERLRQPVDAAGHFL